MTDTQPGKLKEKKEKKRASMPDAIVCGRLLGKTQDIQMPGVVVTRTPMLIPIQGRRFLVGRPWLLLAELDYGRRVTW